MEMCREIDRIELSDLLLWRDYIFIWISIQGFCNSESKS